MENRTDIKDRFAEMWKKSRQDGGKSQEYMAKALGVSKKTIQNWENGTGCPTQELGFEWFDALGLQPLPYYMELLYPKEYNMLRHTASDESVTDMLIQAILGLGEEQKRKLLFLFTGNHGSSAAGVIELMTAHLQSPLRDRINVAQSASTNYKLARETGKIKSPDEVQPNLELLDYSIYKGTAAVIKGQEGYSAIYGEEEVKL